MTILRSNINKNDPQFFKNKEKFNIDYQLTFEAINYSMNGGGEKLNEPPHKTWKNSSSS
jgi:hypothetical protein